MSLLSEITNVVHLPSSNSVGISSAAGMNYNFSGNPVVAGQPGIFPSLVSGCLYETLGLADTLDQVIDRLVEQANKFPDQIATRNGDVIELVTTRDGNLLNAQLSGAVPAGGVIVQADETTWEGGNTGADGVPAYKAFARVKMGGTATGDGTISYTIGTTPYVHTPGAGENAQDALIALGVLINAGTQADVFSIGIDWETWQTALTQIMVLEARTAGAAGNAPDVIFTVTDTGFSATSNSFFGGGTPAIDPLLAGQGPSERVQFDLPVIGTVTVPMQWITGDNALLRRHLKSLGFQLEGSDTGKLISQGQALAATILSQI